MIVEFCYVTLNITESSCRPRWQQPTMISAARGVC